MRGRANHLLNSIFFKTPINLLLIYKGFTFNLEATWITNAEIYLNILLFYDPSSIVNHCRLSVATTKSKKGIVKGIIFLVCKIILEHFFPVKLCCHVVIQFSYLINRNVADITFCSEVWLHKIPDDITMLFSMFLC